MVFCGKDISKAVKAAMRPLVASCSSFPGPLWLALAAHDGGEIITEGLLIHEPH